MIRVSISFLLLLTANVSASASVHIEHEYDRFLHDIPLHEVCLTVTEIRSIHPVRTCVKLTPVDQSPIPERPNLFPTWTCAKFANVNLVYPREIQTAFCAPHATRGSGSEPATSECLDVVYRRETLPSTIRVREVETNSGRTKFDSVSRTHTFPDCD